MVSYNNIHQHHDKTSPSTQKKEQMVQNTSTRTSKSTSIKRFVSLFFSNEYLCGIRNKTEFSALILYFNNFREKFVCASTQNKNRHSCDCFRCMGFRRHMCKHYHTKVETHAIDSNDAKCELLKRLVYENVFGGRFHKRDWGHDERISILLRKSISNNPQNKWMHDLVVTS